MVSNSFPGADFEICAPAYIVPRGNMGGDEDVDVILGQKVNSPIYFVDIKACHRLTSRSQCTWYFQ